MKEPSSTSQIYEFMRLIPFSFVSYRGKAERCYVKINFFFATDSNPFNSHSDFVYSLTVGSSSMLLGGGQFFQVSMYSFLGCVKAKTLFQKGCEIRKGKNFVSKGV